MIPAYAAELAPLFQSQETLDITLRGPFRQIDRERDKDQEYEGALSYQTPDGQEVVLDANFEARGNFRLSARVCRFSQLWVDLKRGQVPGTLFADQNRLKLVVQCRPQSRYEAYLIKEYLAYRMFSELSDYDFKVRLVNVTYEYTDNEGESRTHLGLLVENKDTVAERHGTETYEENTVSLSALDPRQSTLVALFMMMIGNTDFSLAAGPEGDECCHNAKLLDTGGAYLPVPYDFDGSGFVDANYAADPDPSFRIRSNRQRLYRGYCMHNEQVEQVLPVFGNAQDDIMGLLNDTRLSSREIGRAVSYMEEFFDALNDPDKVQDRIIEVCRE
jgi:hypothetical protein